MGTWETKSKNGKEIEERNPQVARKYLKGLGRVLALLSLLYVFVSSLTLLEVSFRLLAGRSAGDVFQTELLHNPIVGLIIGILFTVLVQSSSTCTTVIVSLVASDVIPVGYAIPMVMGANIGTSMTSTLVSLTQITNSKHFERAFSAATVHDCFNWIAVIILLTIESTTGYLRHLTEFIVGIHTNGSNSTEGTKLKIPNVLDMATDPFTNLIIRIDSKILTCWSQGSCQEGRLLKVYCNKTEKPILTHEDRCGFLFNIPELSDAAIGWTLLVIALITLTGCLLLLVKVLQSLLKGAVAEVIKDFINADVPYVPFLTGYIAIVMGAVLTFAVQSSSVFTSTITPLVGIGLIEVDRMYPLVLGSNMGTTSTALIAGFASGRKEPLQIALCHTFFNLSGILLMYPIPFTRVPLVLCKILGRTTAKYRWFSIIYLVIMFFLLPGFILGLSLAGTVPLMAIFGILAFALSIIVIINIMQSRTPNHLPDFLKTWDFLPLPMRSLKPFDKGVMACLSACCFCCPHVVDKFRTVDKGEFTFEEGKNGAVITEQPPSNFCHTNYILNIADETSQSK